MKKQINATSQFILVIACFIGVWFYQTKAKATTCYTHYACNTYYCPSDKKDGCLPVRKDGSHQLGTKQCAGQSGFLNSETACGEIYEYWQGACQISTGIACGGGELADYTCP